MNLRREAIASSDYWEFQPGERVMTIDGIPGTVDLVEDGPIAGAENYVVTLDRGLGGGNYSASMLAKMPTSRSAAGVHLATDDYPELGTVIDDRPDPGKMTFTAALSPERQAADAEDHDEPGTSGPPDGLPKDSEQPSSCSYCGGTEFKDHTDNGRVRQATCAVCNGTMSAHPGMQWTPELIGDPSNHPATTVDPRSGASGAGGQTGINDSIDFDSRVSTTAAYEAGPCPTCKGKGTVSWTDQDPDWGGDPDENPGKVHTAPCDDCGGKGHMPAVSDDEIAHLKQQADENRARSTAQHVQEKHPVGEVVTYDDVKGCGPRCPVAAEWDRRWKRPFYHQGAVDGPDWCTWRRTARCTFPGDITTDGHVLGIPQDRGPCPWETRWQQQVCPISEPGPGAGMERKGSVNLTLLKIAGVPTLPKRVDSDEDSKPSSEEVRAAMHRLSAQMHTAGHLDLYHRTTPEAAQEIYHDKAMRSKENTGETYWSTHRNGEATGYGGGLVHIRVPEHLAEIEDEFPDGEEHYRVRPGHLQPHHFVED
jgi:hypothetical protein